MISPVSFLFLEALAVAAMLLGLFRLRARFGLAPLYISVGAIQFLQVMLAKTIYIEVAPGLLVSPGSAILFTASLFAVLLVYIREDANEARKLIYGLVAANVSLSILSLFVAYQIDAPGTHNFTNLPSATFLQDPRILLVGTAALVCDVLLLILLYEWISRHLTRSLFLRICTAMFAIVTFDTVFFVTGAFVESPEYLSILMSGLAGKLTSSFLFAILLAFYLKYFEPREVFSSTRGDELADIFHVLTYREKYHLLKKDYVRDALTGVYNRGFFDDNLARELERARRLYQSVALILLDLDHFKSLNDNHGHTEGDRVLRVVGQALTETLRAGDLPCRYGGEEFAVIVPNATAVQARRLTRRIRACFDALSADLDDPFPHRVTMTAGIAAFPVDAETNRALIDAADRRLYRGKRAGRDRIVAADALPHNVEGSALKTAKTAQAKAPRTDGI